MCHSVTPDWYENLFIHTGYAVSHRFENTIVIEIRIEDHIYVVSVIPFILVIAWSCVTVMGGICEWYGLFIGAVEFRSSPIPSFDILSGSCVPESMFSKPGVVLPFTNFQRDLYIFSLPLFANSLLHNLPLNSYIPFPDPVLLLALTLSTKRMLEGNGIDYLPPAAATFVVGV